MTRSSAHRRRIPSLVILVLSVMLLGVPAVATADVQVWFVKGEQLGKVARPGTTTEDAVRQLLAGPTAAERKQGVRTQIPGGTPVRSVTVDGDLVTVDLGLQFVLGDQGAESQNARLARLMSTVTGTVGTAGSTTPVKRMQLLIQGGVPLGLFPGIRTDQPITSATLETPATAKPTYPSGPTGSATASTREIQQRLAALGYLTTADVDGRTGPKTQAAIIAFQKWERLGRDGVVGPATRARLAKATRPTPRTKGGSGRRIEVLLDRQVALAIENNRVVRTIHVSTGTAATPTRVGTFSVYLKTRNWWSVPFRTWLPYALAFDGGIAFHEYAPVPTQPASHGCVRITAGTAQWLYNFASVGTQVKVLAR